MGLGRSAGDLSDLMLERRLAEFAPGEVGPGETWDRYRGTGNCQAKGSLESPGFAQAPSSEIISFSVPCPCLWDLGIDVCSCPANSLNKLFILE